MSHRTGVCPVLRPLTTWTRPKSRRIHYTHAPAEASTDRARSLTLYSFIRSARICQNAKTRTERFDIKFKRLLPIINMHRDDMYTMLL